MSLKAIGRNKMLVHLMIFVFILLLSHQGIPARSRVEKHEDEPSFRVKKAISNSLPASAQDFDQLLREARKLYDEMDYEGAVQKLRAAEKLARTAMQKADVYFYLSLAYYATLGGRDRSELLSTLEKVFVFDYQREPDPELCPSGYIEVFNELKASYGAIRILSQPDGADVYINRSLAGKTPLTIGAKAGQINILLKKGKVEKQDQLDVIAGDLVSSQIYDLAGRKGKFPIALVLGGLALAGGAAALALKGGGGGNGGGGATTGNIQVNSSPTGAKVYLDGSDTGKVTNATLTNVAPGSHTVKLTKDGYSDKEQSVSVSAGQTATVDLTLTKDTITVTQPAAGTTWTLGSSVTISWQVSAGTSLQSEPVAAGPPGAGLQNEHLYNARFLRTSRDLADLRGVGSGKFGREGRGKSPGRGESIREMQGSPGRSAALASASPRYIPGGGFPLSLNRIPNSRLGRQTDDTARVLAISKVKIELYKGSNLTSTIAQETDNDGSHSWQVPTTLAGGSDYKVRVSCTSDTSVYGESGNFTIASSAGTINVTQPASGVVWKKSLAYSIKWTSTLSGNVKIELYKGDSLALTIKTSAQDDGEYQWTVPVSLADGSDYSILITSVEKPAVSGRSASFTITHWYEFMTKWGSGGSGNGQFNSPWGIAVDNSGNVYVVDTGNNRVQKFTSSGAYVTKWGSLGTGNGQFHEPYGIAVDSSGYVYVADRENNRIQKFTSSGGYIHQWGTAGSGDGQFNKPQGITADTSGNIYVTDVYNSRVQKFTSGGAFISKWGTWGSGDGQFQYPVGIEIDNSGNVFVTELENRLQKFNSNGGFLAKWGSAGSGDGEFNVPYDVAIDGSGRVCVIEARNYRVQIFDSNGTFLEKWGSQGSADGQFNFPTSIAIDNSGYIYISDTSNDRIQKFRRIG
jgi:DNA-binding beta-propeller fold protein YncE